jgi:hypothetical protein
MILSATIKTLCQVLGKILTLLGRYEAIEAVNTTDPLMPSLIKARAAALAVKKAPNSYSNSTQVYPQRG